MQITIPGKLLSQPPKGNSFRCLPMPATPLISPLMANIGQDWRFSTVQEAALTVVPIQARLHVIKCFTGNSYIQSPLGFATLDKAAALALATATPLTDLRQYINSDLGYSDLEI